MEKHTLNQILMFAFTQTDSFSRTVPNVDSFWSLTLSTDLVYSHLLPPSQSLFSSLPHVASAEGFWKWDNVLPPQKGSWSVPQPMLGRHAALLLDRWTCLSKVCCKFFHDKNPLLLLKNTFFFLFLFLLPFFLSFPRFLSRKESDTENNAFLIFCWKKPTKIFHQEGAFSGLFW